MTPPFVGIGRADAADAEAVAPVNVGHRQAGVLNAGQEGDVGDLLRRLVLLDQRHQLFVGVDQAIDAHARLVGLGDPPAAVVDLLQRAAVGILRHEVAPLGCKTPAH